MNNSFTQKAQHYLNESYRLTEELDSQIEYSGILEAVLEELVGTEDFLEIMEYYLPRKGTSPTQRVAQDGTVTQRTPQQTQHYLKRLDSIRRIGVRALKTQDDTGSAEASKGAGVVEPKGTNIHKYVKARDIGRRVAASLIGHGGNNSLDAGVATVPPHLNSIPSSSDGFNQQVNGLGGQQGNPRTFGRANAGVLAFDTSGVHGERREMLQGAKDRSRSPDWGTFNGWNRDNWKPKPNLVGLTLALNQRRNDARARNKETGAEARAIAFNRARRGETVSLGADGEQFTATSSPYKKSTTRKSKKKI